jgi:protein-tyrosine phosphatase
VNILFVCSRNQWRSPTAETIYKNRSDLNVKSAGTEPSARNKLTAKTIRWADIIFVMEKKHKQRMMEKFPFETQQKQIIILHIPDEYTYMDDELIEDIQTKVNVYISK